MKKLLFALLFVSATTTAIAQETEDKSLFYPEKVRTLESTVKTLYEVISGEKDVERDWKLFKYLFKNDAKLIPSGKNKEGKIEVRYLSPGDYIKNSGSWLVENGFIEKEIHQEVEVFGNIAHVFSTYEAFNSETDEEPFMRGINSIQLLNDGERWWIINVYWSQENRRNTIPDKYLN